MSIRIHPKYFNKFMAGLAVIFAILIFFGSLRYAQNQQTRFESNLGDGHEVSEMKFQIIGTDDSLSVSDFSGRPVILDFWATWAQRSAYAHREMAEIKQNHPDMVVIAAAVKDGDDYLDRYREETDYDFIYVDGTQIYQDIKVPGLPTQLVFNEQGSLEHIFVGYRDTGQFYELWDFAH